jgi:thiamine-monophosphate kinase
VRPDTRDEDAWIAAVSRRFGASPRVLLGPGHDAAVVAFDGREVVLKTDTVVDGVDFRLEACGPRAAGRKALAVTASDLAAMAATPRACVVSAVLPPGVTFETFDGIAAGLADAAEETGCEVVGGDTSVAPGPLVITVSAIGEPGPAGVVGRRGARPGDALSVTGALGGSILGRHLTFRPRLAEAQVLASERIPRAMMDLSDGLSTDLPRLCAMSGVGADVEAARVPIHPDAVRAGGARSPLEHALHDGEDFELLLAHAPLEVEALAALAARGVTLHRIGTVTAAAGEVRLLRDGRATPLERGGYDHLARTGP